MRLDKLEAIVSDHDVMIKHVDMLDETIEENATTFRTLILEHTKRFERLEQRIEGVGVGASGVIARDAERIEKLESRVAELEVNASRKVAALPTGMSLRDYFAGQALVGAVSGMRAPEMKDLAWLAGERCYEMATAMLAAREAKP